LCKTYTKYVHLCVVTETVEPSSPATPSLSTTLTSTHRQYRQCSPSATVTTGSIICTSSQSCICWYV